MDILLASCAEAFRLLFSGDPDIWEIIAISFRVSSLAILCAVPPALVIAFSLAYGNFFGRRFLILVFNTFLSVPAVVIGLTLFIILSRQGPMGDFKLLFTQTAMGIGQFLLCLPILVCMVHVALQAAACRPPIAPPGKRRARSVRAEFGHFSRYSMKFASD